jgi:hypothetical protein
MSNGLKLYLSHQLFRIVSLFAVFQCLAQSSRAKCSKLTGREAQWPWTPWTPAHKGEVTRNHGGHLSVSTIYIYISIYTYSIIIYNYILYIYIIFRCFTKTLIINDTSAIRY